MIKNACRINVFAWKPPLFYGCCCVQHMGYHVLIISISDLEVSVKFSQKNTIFQHIICSFIAVLQIK